MTDNLTLLQRDLAVLWHPCSQMRDYHPEHPQALPLIPIQSGQGVWLYDFDGRRYLDAVSSWWVNLFGHSHPHINAAIKQQLDQLEHVIFGGFSHEPGIQLAEKLAALTPPGLNKCFYADNGSSAVEIALKMSFHYWRNQGRPEKTRFVTLSNSYHGETLGALSVGDVALYKQTYAPLLLQTLTVPSPDCYHREAGESWQDHSRRRFTDMELCLSEHADEICAVIVEPLVQCAGGMRMYHPIYLSLLREACDRHGVHLIADEIAVGFGRTGTLFACEQADISPDFICLSKGLTGGYLPLAAVLTRDEIYAAFYGEYATLKAFLHSHSYTGNPLGCRAALASLELFEQLNAMRQNQVTARLMAEAVADLADHPHVAEIRQTGMILAMELCQDKAARRPFPWQERRGLKAYRRALELGVLLRPLGDVIYFMPPYIITPHEIQLMADAAKQAIHHAVQN